MIGIVQEIYKRGSIAGKAKEAIQSDVSSMILLFLSRGNNVDKMLLRTNDVGRTRINTLKTTYKLANNVGRGGNSIITLSRVAAVYPVVTLKLLSTVGANIPRAVSLSATDFGADFPRQMQTVIAAAIFPKGALGVQLMKALLLYIIEENKLLSNVGNASDADILQKVTPFARASFVSGIVGHTDRLVICTELGLTDGANRSTRITVAVNTFNQKYPVFDLSFIA